MAGKETGAFTGNWGACHMYGSDYQGVEGPRLQEVSKTVTIGQVSSASGAAAAALSCGNAADRCSIGLTSSPPHPPRPPLPCLCLQWCLGFSVFLLPWASEWLRALLKPFHVFFGASILSLAVASVISGINEKLIFSL